MPLDDQSLATPVRLASQLLLAAIPHAVLRTIYNELFNDLPKDGLVLEVEVIAILSKLPCWPWC